MDKLVDWGYFGMFLSAFLAGSIVPANSEIVLSALITVGLDKWWLLLWATLGNLLGGMTCYYLGYLGKMEWITKYMRVKQEKVEKVHKFLDGKGAWVAFFGFVPFVVHIRIRVFVWLRFKFLTLCIAILFG